MYITWWFEKKHVLANFEESSPIAMSKTDNFQSMDMWVSKRFSFFLYIAMGPIPDEKSEED